MLGVFTRLSREKSAGIVLRWGRQINADVAQLVEHLVANQKVVGSTPIIRSKQSCFRFYWGIAKSGYGTRF